MASFHDEFDDWLNMPSINLMGPSHNCLCAASAAFQQPANTNTQTTAIEQPALPSIQWQLRDESVSLGDYQDFKVKMEADIQRLRLDTDSMRKLTADVEKMRVELASHLQDYHSLRKQTRELGQFTKVLRDHVKELISKGNPGVIVQSPKGEAAKKEGWSS